MKAVMLFLALAIAVPMVATPVFAQDDKKLAEACKGKKAGDTVKVDGKDVKCK